MKSYYKECKKCKKLMPYLSYFLSKEENEKLTEEDKELCHLCYCIKYPERHPQILADTLSLYHEDKLELEEEKKILDMLTKRLNILKDLETIRDEIIKIQKDYKIRYSIIGVIDNIIKKYL